MRWAQAITPAVLDIRIAKVFAEEADRFLDQAFHAVAGFAGRLFAEVRREAFELLLALDLPVEVLLERALEFFVFDGLDEAGNCLL